MNNEFMSSNDIRHEFSVAMSTMYQKEVPLYGDLIDLVTEVNTEVLASHSDIKAQLEHTGEIDRLSMERHGAIRLGTAAELSMMRRLFAVMGMYPVGYYDLAPAGVPVHSTAFRAIDSESLNKSPFRVFTSLLRLDLIGDNGLKQEAIAALEKRQIFTDNAVHNIDIFEKKGGLTPAEAKQFVIEALETFRWHDKTPVSKKLYEKLLNQHPLIADVVGFKGPHINHLTPRTLDIDAVQQDMQARGIPPKAIIEGPPRRACPILLRQTSFKALEEKVSFKSEQGSSEKNIYEENGSEKDSYVQGHHTARFGEIEQRGVALTPKGRALYDKLLSEARKQLGVTPNENNAAEYYKILEKVFSAFPDDYQALHSADLAYFYYQANEQAIYENIDNASVMNKGASNLKSEGSKVIVSKQALTDLINQGAIRIEPIVYEDFLPVSAAGIFQSNLNEDKQSNFAEGYEGNSNKQEFERALGTSVHAELALYDEMQAQSLKECLLVLEHCG